MENTTDVSTESDTVLTCRLRYRCFYSSFWTCFVSQLPNRDIADANRLFVSPCAQFYCSNHSVHILGSASNITPSCFLSEKSDLSLTCWPDMLICYLSDIWHPMSPLLPSPSVSLTTIHSSRPYWMFFGTKTNTHRVNWCSIDSPVESQCRYRHTSSHGSAQVNCWLPATAAPDARIVGKSHRAS